MTRRPAGSVRRRRRNEQQSVDALRVGESRGGAEPQKAGERVTDNDPLAVDQLRKLAVQLSFPDLGVRVIGFGQPGIEDT